MKALKPGYFLQPDTRSGAHVLGGTCTCKGAVSPNSGRPLTQMALLDTRTPELSAWRFGLDRLPLLYGWSCAISDDALWYRALPDEIELVSFQSGAAYSDFPYEHYPEHFPAVTASARKMTSQQQNAIVQGNHSIVNFSAMTPELESLLRPHHQIGGEPYIGYEYALNRRCLSCSHDMQFFASAANYLPGVPAGFMGNDFAQLLYFLCEKCQTICADNITG